MHIQGLAEDTFSLTFLVLIIELDSTSSPTQPHWIVVKTTSTSFNPNVFAHFNAGRIKKQLGTFKFYVIMHSFVSPNR